MMVSDKLPASSTEVPLLGGCGGQFGKCVWVNSGKYYMGLLTIMVFATITTTFTMSLQMRGNDGRRLGLFYRRVFKTRLANWFVSPPLAILNPLDSG